MYFILLTSETENAILEIAALPRKPKLTFLGTFQFLNNLPTMQCTIGLSLRMTTKTTYKKHVDAFFDFAMFRRVSTLRMGFFYVLLSSTLFCLVFPQLSWEFLKV